LKILCVALRVVAGSPGDDGPLHQSDPDADPGGTERNPPTMALPTLTVAQRDEALRKAQAARLARKQLLAAIAAGEQTIPAVLDQAKTDTIIGRTKVADLLKSLPGYGPAKVTALMKQTGIVSSRRAAGLGERQRQALTAALT
jgi:hypothetical protein